MAEQRKGLFFPKNITDLGFILKAPKKIKKSQKEQRGMTEAELEAARERARAIVAPKPRPLSVEDKRAAERDRAMSGRERQTIIDSSARSIPDKPRDLRQRKTPTGEKWFGAPRKSALETITIQNTVKGPLGRKRTKSQTFTANPYSSVAATDFLGKYYGDDDLVNQINEARIAEKQNRALVGDRMQRATDIVPVYRDKGQTTFKTTKGEERPSAGRYFSGQFKDPESFEGKRKLHINMPTTVLEGQEGTWEHESGHHLNLFTPEYYRKVEGLLPEGGKLKRAPKGAMDRNYIHAFTQPQELAEAIGRMQRQWYAYTKANPKEYPEGPRRMSDKDFDRLMNAANEPPAFKGLGDFRNAGHFIRAIKQLKKEDPKKGKALIDEIRKIKDSFVDTGESKFFPTENIA